MAGPEIVARLRLRGEEFSRTLQREFARVPAEAEKSAEVAGARFGEKFGRNLGIGIAAAATGIGVIIAKATDNARELQASATSVGVLVEEYQELSFAAGQVGVSQETLKRETSDLTQKIGEAANGNRAAQQSFADLGISYETAAGKARPTIDVMGDLADKVASFTAPADQATAAAKLLGEGADEMTPLLLTGAAGMAQMAADARELGVVLSDEQIRDLNITAGKMQAFNNVMSAQISGIVADNAQAIINIANSIGYASQKVGEFMSRIEGAKRLRADVGSWDGYWDYSAEDQKAYATNRGRTQVRRRELGASIENYRLAQTGLLNARTNPRSSLSVREAQENVRSTRAVMIRETELTRKARDDYERELAASRVTLATAGAPPIVDPKTPRATRGRRAGGKSDAEREAEKAAKEAEAAARAYSQMLGSLGEIIVEQERSNELDRLRAEGLTIQADREEALLKLTEMFPDVLATMLKSDEARAAALYDQFTAAEALVGAAADEKALREAVAAIDEKRADVLEEATRAQKEALEEAADLQRDQFEDLADFYGDLFRGRTDDIWQNFKDAGMDILADLAAQWTLSLLSGGKAGLGDLAGSGAGSGRGNPLSALLGSFGGAGGGGGGSGGGGLLGRLFGGSGGGGYDAQAIRVAQYEVADGASQPGGVGAPSLGAGGFESAIATSVISAIEAITNPSAKNIGGAVGSVGGAVVGGFFGGPAGAAVGAFLGDILGSLVGGLFTSTPWTSQRASTAGDNPTGAAGEIITASRTAIEDIAKQLGAQYDPSRSDVVVGTYGGHYRVSTKGFDGKMKYEDLGKGVYNTGDDAEATARLVIADMIADGVITGISDASQRILKNAGKDLDAALDKALMIESIPKLLRERLDPLGAALDEIDDKFRDLAEALREGAASAEQIAEARQLWELERADAIRAIGEAGSTLKDFLRSLKLGGDSPLSLRNQRTEAQAVLDPYLAQARAARDADAVVRALDARRAGGETIDAATYDAAVKAARAAAGAIDQEGFAEASSVLLGLTRQIDGSTGAFFQQYDQIASLTRDAIAAIERAVPQPGAASDPFSAAIAQATGATANILDGHTAQLATIGATLAAILARTGSGGGGDFIGGERLFETASLR